MKGIKNIFYTIGINPVPFFYGWLSAVIAFIIFFVIIKL